MPLELCRHWLSYESMFECQTASKIEFVDMVGLHWGVLVTGTQSNFINLHCNWWWQLVTLSRSTTRSTRVWCDTWMSFTLMNRTLRNCNPFLAPFSKLTSQLLNSLPTVTHCPKWIRLIYSNFLWIELNSSQVASMATIAILLPLEDGHGGSRSALHHGRFLFGSRLPRFNLISFNISRN